MTSRARPSKGAGRGGCFFSKNEGFLGPKRCILLKILLRKNVKKIEEFSLAKKSDCANPKSKCAKTVFYGDLKHGQYTALIFVFQVVFSCFRSFSARFEPFPHCFAGFSHRLFRFFGVVVVVAVIAVAFAVVRYYLRRRRRCR